MASDALGIVVLIILYAAQGIPMGLFWGSMRIVLADKFSYSELAIFGLASYPYSLKLLWSPIVDCVYSEKIGRRKSWLFPCQTMMGILMIYISYNVTEWMDNLDVRNMTIWCFVTIFFTATQDIAVDGWSLTILSKENVSYQSTCQSFGMSLGWTIGYPVFLALNSDEICSSYFSVDSKIITLPQFFYLCGTGTILMTIFIASFVSENKDENGTLDNLTISKTYVDIFRILKMRNVMELAVVLLTRQLTFTAIDSVSAVKLQKEGFPKEISGLLIFIYVPFNLAYPLILRCLRDKNFIKMNYLTQYKYAYVVRIAIGLIGAYNVHSFALDSDGNVPSIFIVKLVIITIVYSFVTQIQFTNQCAFFAEIADPVIGGTYLTLLNTIANFGITWPKYFVLKAVDMLTVTVECDGDNKEQCNGKESMIERDGYYIIVTFCALYGIIWIGLTRNKLTKFDHLPKETSWRILGTEKKDN